MSNPRLLEFLSDRGNYPEKPAQISRLETDLSWFFFAGDRVYKLKKPIKFNGFDFSTVVGREKACHREIRLNNRLAKGVYEDVVPIYEEGDRFTFQGTGAPAEVCLRMRRLPEERMLDRLLVGDAQTSAAPSLADQDIGAVIDALASFYDSAKSGEKIARAASSAAIEALCRCTLKSLRELFPGRPELDHIESAQLEFIARHPQLFEERIERGKIRDNHGDLRLEHICLTDPPTILGCVEFNDRARHTDVIEDVAGLAVDCDLVGQHELGVRIWNELSRRLGEDPDHPLFFFYCSLQAAIRAKHDAGISRSGLARLGDCSSSAPQPDRHLALANAYCSRFHKPRLFVTVGVMGTGKSTLACALAQTMGLKKVSAESAARELLQVEGSNRRPPRPGDADFNRALYERVLVQARTYLERGASVVIDGRFLTRAQRDAVQRLAATQGAPLLFLECRLAKSDAIARLDQRFRKDRTRPGMRPELYDEQRTRFEPLDDIPPSQLLSLNTLQQVPALVDAVLESLGE